MVLVQVRDAARIRDAHHDHRRQVAPVREMRGGVRGQGEGIVRVQRVDHRVTVLRILAVVPGQRDIEQVVLAILLRMQRHHLTVGHHEGMRGTGRGGAPQGPRDNQSGETDTLVHAVPPV